MDNFGARSLENTYRLEPKENDRYAAPLTLTLNLDSTHQRSAPSSRRSLNRTLRVRSTIRPKPKLRLRRSCARCSNKLKHCRSLPTRLSCRLLSDRWPDKVCEWQANVFGTRLTIITLVSPTPQLISSVPEWFSASTKSDGGRYGCRCFC